MSVLARWRSSGSRVGWAVVVVCLGAAALLGSTAPVVVAAEKDLASGDGQVQDFGDISDVPKTVVNRVIDDADGSVERYRFDLSSPQSVEVVLRLLTANADVFLEDADGEVLGSGTELGRSDERFSLTLAAGTYGVRVESSGPVRYRMKLKVTEPVGDSVGKSTTESPVDSETGDDPQPEADTGTDTGTDPVEAWTAVLDVGANDDGAGYSRWAQFGSLTPVLFEVDGSSYDVILLAEIAGGLYLGLRRSLDIEFMLEINGEQFVGSQSQVPNGLPLRGTYWWPTDGVLSGSVGSTAAVSLSAGTDSLGERGAAPPGAWFSQVPGFHDGTSEFSLRVSFDESDLGVTTALLTDALVVTGGSLVTVSEVSPVGRTWELDVAPDGPGDVTVSLVAASDCVSVTSVCSADGRMLRNTPQATVDGPATTTRLASLNVGSLTLSPAFDPEVTLYSISAPSGTQQVTVKADPAHPSGVVVVSPEDAKSGVAGHQIALEEGAQTVVGVKVVAGGGAERTYWVVIDVPGHNPDVLGVRPPTLNGLAVAGADELGFDPAVTRYETSADAGVDTVTIIPARHDTGATVQIVTVQGNDPTLAPSYDDSDPNQDGHQSALASDGDTLVLVIVTSADEQRQQIYVVLISREGSGQQATTKNAGYRSVIGNDKGLGSPRSVVVYNKADTRQSTLPVLASLALTEATISPAFAAGTTEYTAEVDGDVGVVTVSASTPTGVTYLITPTDADTETEGHQVALAESQPGGEPTETAIAIVARNAENAVETYTITVTRAPPPITIPPEGCELQQLEEQDDGTLTHSGQWPLSCQSILRFPQWRSDYPAGRTRTGNAHFYELTLTQQSDVRITVESHHPRKGPSSTHTVVRDANGALLEHHFNHVNFDNEECLCVFAIKCAPRAYVDVSLEAGTYYIEVVQHYSADGRRRSSTTEVEFKN
ncbi:MAG: cadherin-like beta sandwich domain-containing protein [bacterium]|nr:cadherin-like beta sandwich domain-containing protein [bacterium]